MLKTLFCKINIGHRWMAEADRDGTFTRHCVKCGKVDPHAARWSELLSDRDRPTRSNFADPITPSDGPGFS